MLIGLLELGEESPVYREMKMGFKIVERGSTGRT